MRWFLLGRRGAGWLVCSLALPMCMPWRGTPVYAASGGQRSRSRGYLDPRFVSKKASLHVLDCAQAVIALSLCLSRLLTDIPRKCFRSQSIVGIADSVVPTFVEIPTLLRTQISPVDIDCGCDQSTTIAAFFRSSFRKHTLIVPSTFGLLATSTGVSIA